ncbi:MAG: ABC transporter ATP-binding protein [Fusobacterium sp. JB020]|nr:ABC transporter ATP-binding protein [Fusobacterium sp. JB020]
MSKFKIILKYYFLEKKLLSIFLITSLGVTLLDLSSPIIVKKIIDHSLPNKNLEELFYLSGLVLFIYICRGIILIYSSSRGQLLGNKLKFHMRNDLISHFLKQSFEFFYKKNSGELISRIIGDLENVSTLLYKGLESFLSSLLVLIGSFLLMLKFSPILAGVTFIPLPFAFIFVYLINGKLKKGYFKIRKENSNLTSFINDIFRLVFFIKDNSLEEDHKKKFIETNVKLLKLEKDNFLNSAYLMGGIVFYNQFLQLLLIFIGGILFINNKISLGIIISFLLLVDRFKVSLMRFIGLIDLYQRGMVGISRFQEGITTKNYFIDGNIELKEELECIEFKNVSFSYDGKVDILKNINFKILKGKKIAIGGQSGVGKSTIFNLIKKSYLPTEGNIYINGIDIRKIKTASLLEKIGIINREENLFNDTVLENIRIVNREKYTVEEVMDATKKACIHDKIINLEKKYKTLLGTDGINLSNGEEQRISIARIFLKKARLIMLDEATSGLDNIIESEIIENIYEFFKEETILVITHKLELLKEYDEIILIENGEIIEKGTYEELIRLKNKFYKILKKTS